jgi:hypothetical protein
VVLVERDGAFILGIDKHRARRYVGLETPGRGVGEQRAVEPPAMKAPVNSETANADRRERRVAPYGSIGAMTETVSSSSSLL